MAEGVRERVVVWAEEREMRVKKEKKEETKRKGIWKNMKMVCCVGIRSHLQLYHKLMVPIL